MPEQEASNRQILLEEMQRTVSDWLEAMGRLLPLRFAERSDAGEPLGASAATRPSDTTPITVYDAATANCSSWVSQGRARACSSYSWRRSCWRARQDAAHPAPVIFSLATWREDQRLEDWMIAELQQHYPNGQAAVRRLVEQRQILSLLDGLDEVETQEQRGQCVAAINAYAQQFEGHTPLVITCRIREYADLPALRLYGAVAIKLVSQAQSAAYLAGPRYAALRAARDRDAVLRDAARVPLLLGMMGRTYQERAPRTPRERDAGSGAPGHPGRLCGALLRAG